MNITLLTNNKKSWFWEYNELFAEKLRISGHKVNVISENKELKEGGDICFFLACTQLVPEEHLKYHKFNLVIHHSALPKGKGSSPLVWQIIEGKNNIVFTLFEAQKNVDSGNIYIQKELELEGHELLNEIFYKRCLLEEEMILEFINNNNQIKSFSQKGEETIYPRRSVADDELPIDVTIEELFNRFRIVDNEKWPAFFKMHGYKYYLKIYKDKM